MISPLTVNLPDDLFNENLGDDDDDGDDGGGEEDDDGETPKKTMTLFPEKEPPSREFLSLVGKTKEKIERRRKKPKTVAAAVFNRALEEVDAMLRSGDWEGAGARHLVALYDRMHHRCYGVVPAELGPAERFNAAMLAGNMMKREFGGDLPTMVDYMLWAWQRELEREQWRRENGREGGRIGVRLMFCGALLTDYRVHLARRPRRA